VAHPSIHKHTHIHFEDHRDFEGISGCDSASSATGWPPRTVPSLKSTFPATPSPPAESSRSRARCLRGRRTLL